MNVDISEAIELFEVLADMMEGTAARSLAPRTRYEHQQSMVVVRKHAVDTLLESVGATRSHPVTRVARAYMAAYSPVQHSIEDAEGVRKWANSTELQEKANLWAELAALPEEYAAEILA